MSYTDLSTMKKINGEPADLRYFVELNENDAFLKNAIDTDEDLTALDRDIIPVTDLGASIGSSSKRIFDSYLYNIFSKNIYLPGMGTVPSLFLGTDLLTGIGATVTNGIYFRVANSQPLTASTSDVIIQGSNNGVLKLRNTLPASASSWALGSDETGFALTDTTSGSSVKALFGPNFTTLYNNLRLITGTEMNPAITFQADPTTGIHKDISSPILNFAISGSDKLSLSSAALSVLTSLVIPTGTAGIPSLSFAGNLDYGLSLIGDSLGIINAGKLSHQFSPTGMTISSETEVNNSVEVHNDTFGIVELYKKAAGTLVAPATLEDNTDLWIQRIQGYTDTGFQTVAEISSTAIEAYDSGAYGAMLSFSTTSIGGEEVTEKLQIGPAEGAAVNVLESFGLGKVLIDTAGAGQQIDVSAISKIAIDATSGNIEIRGFAGGKEGQMLYIYKKVPNNTFTLIFNSGTAAQKVLLKGSANYVNTNDYGGITLSFDDGIWREVSRS